jgi:hypothetical protein
MEKNGAGVALEGVTMINKHHQHTPRMLPLDASMPSDQG